VRQVPTVPTLESGRVGPTRVQTRSSVRGPPELTYARTDNRPGGWNAPGRGTGKEPLRKILAFVVVGLAIAAAVYGGDYGRAADPELLHFVSRPDLTPPMVTIDVTSKKVGRGYIFIAPKKIEPEGPLIVDNRGRPVWFHPQTQGGATDFRVQRYRGRKVLTWSAGH